MGGLLGLHPDYGALTTSKRLRLAHKALSRVATLSAIVAIATGYAKLADKYTSAMVALALAALAIRLSLFGGLSPSVARTGGKPDGGAVYGMGADSGV